MSLAVRAGFAAASLVLAGCAGVQPQTAVGRSFEFKAAVRSTRAAIHEFVPVLSARIEVAAREILERETDPRIRQNVLLWQTNAVSAAATAVFNVDPFIGLVDLLVLGHQMDGLARSDEATLWFGRHQPRIVESCETILADMEELKRVLVQAAEAPPREGASKEIRDWAVAHPMQGLGFARRPVSSEFWDELAQDEYKGLSAVSKIEDLAEDLADRSRVLLALAPRQAQWQGELLMERILGLEEVQAVTRDVSEASQAAVEMAAVIRSLEGRLETVQRDLLRQFDLRMHAIAQQGEAMLTEALSEVDGRQDEAAGALRRMAAQVHTGVVTEMEAQRTALLDDFEMRGRSLVDYAMFRTAQLLGTALILVLVISGALWLMLRPRGASPPASRPPTPAG